MTRGRLKILCDGRELRAIVVTERGQEVELHVSSVDVECAPGEPVSAQVKLYPLAVDLRNLDGRRIHGHGETRACVYPDLLAEPEGELLRSFRYRVDSSGKPAQLTVETVPE